MSKHEIRTVVTLAAYLAMHQPNRIKSDQVFLGARASADTMKLQRLGRQCSTNAVHWCNGTKDEAKCIAANVRYLAQATEILKPYGLKAKVGGDPRGYCLHILGLPGNTLGGDESGYGI